VADDPYLHPPKLPRAPVRDGKLYVEGEKEPYFREPQHTIQLRVHSLTVRRGYQPEDWQNPTSKKKALKETLHGLAENNEFNVIGLDKVYSPSTSIEFLLASVPDTEREFYGIPPSDFMPISTRAPGNPIGPGVSGCTDTARANISTTCSQRSGEITSTISWSRCKRRCGRGTRGPIPAGPGTSQDQPTNPASRRRNTAIGLASARMASARGTGFGRPKRRPMERPISRPMPAKKIVQELDLLRESNSEFSQPASEQGYISSLFWEEKFGLPPKAALLFLP
jgi:hypothetical protein